MNEIPRQESTDRDELGRERQAFRLSATRFIGVGAVIVGARLLATRLANGKVADTAADVIVLYVPPASGGPSLRVVNGARAPVFDCRVEIEGAEPVQIERLGPFEVAEHSVDLVGRAADRREASIEFTMLGHRWHRHGGGRPRLAHRPRRHEGTEK